MNPIRQALFELLNGGLDVPVHHKVAPQGSQPPYVVFHRVPGAAINTFGGDPAERDIWVVRAVCKGASATPAEALAAEVQTLLHRATLSSGARTAVAIFETPVDYPEQDGGTTHHHVGGQYRVTTTS